MKLIATAVILASAFALTGCPTESTQETGSKIQEQGMKRAINAVPVPEVKRFTTRETIARWIKHANKPDQTHYVYVMLPGVGFVGYYVADSAPVNICTAMTPTKRVENWHGSKHIMDSPALDGVYYGGAGCDKWYFFDVTTGAKLEIGGQMAFFVSTAPLAINTPRLEVKVKEE